MKKELTFQSIRSSQELQKKNTIVNLFGIVKDFTPSRQSLHGTKGMLAYHGGNYTFYFSSQELIIMFLDWVTTVYLWDPTCDTSSIGLQIHLFSKQGNDLPVIKQVGQPLLLHQITLRSYRDRTQGLSKDQFRYALWPDFSSNSKDTLCPQPMPRLMKTGDKEEQFALLLNKIWDEQTNKHKNSELLSTSSARQNQTGLSYPSVSFSLLSQITPHQRCSFYAQVIKTWYSDKNFTLYVTDYTENELFFPMSPYTSSSRWRGPFGRFSIRCILWDEHDFYCRNYIKEGDYVVMKNVRTKIDHLGYLECILHGDSAKRYNMSIEKVDSEEPELNEIKSRKRLYVQNCQNGIEAVIEKLSQSQQSENPFIAHELKQTSDNEITAHVINEPASLKLTTISTILHAPLQNLLKPRKHRLRVQVVDFWPKSLTQFAVLSQPPSSYVWMFALLVRDVSNVTLPVIFFDSDAAELINSSKIQPCNLADHPQMTLQLKERLFLIWGNLEERIQHHISKGESPTLAAEDVETPWFDIYVKEYIPVIGNTKDHQSLTFLQKRWRGFGTKIV